MEGTALTFFCGGISLSIHANDVIAFRLYLINRELKNHDDDFVDDDRKWDTVHCASAISKFRRRGVVDDAKHSRVTSSCNPQALAGISPCFKAIFQGLCIFYLRKSRYPFFFLLRSDVDWKFDWWIVFTSKTTLSCRGRASELVSDKFSCMYLGKANHISLT